MSKQPQPAPTASAVGPCPTVILIVGCPGPGRLRRTIAPPDHPQADVVKSSICESYEDTAGHIRVVLCTTSFSMGLDVKVVDTVVHFGPANNLDDYLQETRRAGGRLSENCHAILIKFKHSLDCKNISQEMKTCQCTDLSSQ